MKCHYDEHKMNNFISVYPSPNNINISDLPKKSWSMLSSSPLISMWTNSRSGKNHKDLIVQWGKNKNNDAILSKPIKTEKLPKRIQDIIIKDKI